MTEEKIIEKIGVMETEHVIALWNECIEYTGYTDDRVYENGEDFFNEMFRNPYDAAMGVAFGNWRCSDRYVVFNGYANVESFQYWQDSNSPIDVDVLAEWLMENPDKAAEIGVEDNEEDEEEDD